MVVVSSQTPAIKHAKQYSVCSKKENLIRKLGKVRKGTLVHSEVLKSPLVHLQNLITSQWQRRDYLASLPPASQRKETATADITTSQ
jgi:hypothetical protein